jgi:hypothetical protein
MNVELQGVHLFVSRARPEVVIYPLVTEIREAEEAQRFSAGRLKTAGLLHYVQSDINF